MRTRVGLGAIVGGAALLLVGIVCGVLGLVIVAIVLGVLGLAAAGFGLFLLYRERTARVCGTCGEVIGGSRFTLEYAGEEQRYILAIVDSRVFHLLEGLQRRTPESVTGVAMDVVYCARCTSVAEVTVRSTSSAGDTVLSGPTVIGDPYVRTLIAIAGVAIPQQAPAPVVAAVAQPEQAVLVGAPAVVAPPAPAVAEPAVAEPVAVVPALVDPVVAVPSDEVPPAAPAFAPIVPAPADEAVSMPPLDAPAEETAAISDEAEAVVESAPASDDEILAWVWSARPAAPADEDALVAEVDESSELDDAPADEIQSSPEAEEIDAVSSDWTPVEPVAAASFASAAEPSLVPEGAEVPESGPVTPPLPSVASEESVAPALVEVQPVQFGDAAPAVAGPPTPRHAVGAAPLAAQPETSAIFSPAHAETPDAPVTEAPGAGEPAAAAAQIPEDDDDVRALSRLLGFND